MDFKWILIIAFCVALLSHQSWHGYCEAQGKGKVKGRLRKLTQRSFIDCRL